MLQVPIPGSPEQALRQEHSGELPMPFAAVARWRAVGILRGAACAAKTLAFQRLEAGPVKAIVQCKALRRKGGVFTAPAVLTLKQAHFEMAASVAAFGLGKVAV